MPEGSVRGQRQLTGKECKKEHGLWQIVASSSASPMAYILRVGLGSCEVRNELN
jgi:hypothetical protein